MRNLVLALLFPFTLTAQVELPDSSAAARLGVKKLLVLRVEEGQPVDTELVYRFDPYCKTDHGWRREGSATFKLQPVPDSMKIVVKNAKGQVTFEGRKVVWRKPAGQGGIDTIGTFYFYNAAGRLEREEHWRSPAGTEYTSTYTYDAGGHLSVKTIIPTHPMGITKTEIRYNAAGQVVSETMWWSYFPRNDELPPDPDTRTSKIVYTYDANGLITEAHATDPTHSWHCMRDTTEDPRPVVDKVTFKYVYIY
jgi:hypothetical protein